MADLPFGGVALCFTALDPIRALYWSAVVNGILSAPLIAIMMAIAMNRRVVGSLTMPWWMVIGSGATVLVMAAAAIAFFVL